MRIIPRKSKIAVLDLIGSIERGSGTTNLINTLNELRDDSKIKAVVLNIDCAGGDAAASNSLYLATCKLTEKKPTIAYINGLAASGGYMVSAATTRIIAMPGSFVGSIGVITATIQAHELLDALGVHFAISKSAPLKDMGAFYREMTEEEKQKEQSFVNSFNDYFVSIVAKGRKMEDSKVRDLATGEMFLAETAKDLGLIDELSDLEDTLDEACKLGNVSKKRTHYITPKKGLLQRWLLGASIHSSEQPTVEANYTIRQQTPASLLDDYRLRLRL